jgi:hypothetical protein
MEPINQPARSSAIGRFVGLYSISLLFVVIVAYFLFNTPASLFKNQIAGYKNTQGEQSQLLERVGGMTANLKNIAQADLSYQSSNNDIEKGSLITNMEEYKQGILDGVQEIRNDSAKMTSNLAKLDAFNYTTTFNSVIAYRNTIAYLQKTLQDKGGAANELIQTKAELEQTKTQLDVYKAMAANNKPAPAVVPVPTGGGGGGGGGSSAKEAQMQQALDKCQVDLANCLKAKPSTVSQAPAPVMDEGKKAVVLFEAGQDLYNKAEATKSPIEKRTVLSCSRQILEKAKPAYPDADRINKMINQIDQELRKLSNIG